MAAAGAVPSAGQVQVRLEVFNAYVLLLRVRSRLQRELLQPQADGPGAGDRCEAGFRHRPFFTPDSKATQFPREGGERKRQERAFCSRKLGRVGARARGAASLPDLHVVRDGFALAAQLDVENSRVGGTERLQPHVHPLLAGHPGTCGGETAGGRGWGLSSGPRYLPPDTYEAPGTRGHGCNPWAVDSARSAPARRSPRGWLLPAWDAGGSAPGLEWGWGPGSGPVWHRDPDQD